MSTGLGPPSPRPVSSPTVPPPPLTVQPRRRQAVLDFDSNDEDDQPYSSTAREGGPELRDCYRRCFMTLPCKMFHTFVLFTTLFLVAISFIRPDTTRTVWYHALEGSVILVFAVEVLSRVYIARGHFWVSRFNVAEAAICLVCTASFGAMVITMQGGSQTEHEIVMGLRYVAQLLRVSIYYQSAAKAVTEVASGHVFPSSSAVPREEGRITLIGADTVHLSSSSAQGPPSSPVAPLFVTSSPAAGSTTGQRKKNVGIV